MGFRNLSIKYRVFVTKKVHLDTISFVAKFSRFAKNGVNNFQQAVAMFRELCLARSAAFRLSSRRSLASGTSHHAEENIERKPADYRSASFSNIQFPEVILP